MQKSSLLMIVLISLALCSCKGLMHSARLGNVGGIQEALDSGVSIESTYESTGATALIVAAKNNKVKAVKYLCEQGANVNTQSFDGSTALHFAAYYNYSRVAKVLVKYNADPTLKDHREYTPMDYADYYDHIEVMKVLGYEGDLLDD